MAKALIMVVKSKDNVAEEFSYMLRGQETKTEWFGILLAVRKNGAWKEVPKRELRIPKNPRNRLAYSYEEIK